MKPRLTYLTIFAVTHLFLVICGAAHQRPVSPDSVPGAVLATYGALSGADASYSFFAPRVAPQLKAEFILSDAKGKQWTDSGEWGRTGEASLRFASSISMVNFDELREGVAASWAAAMFGRYPNAVRVEMRVSYQELPTLTEYRDGARPQWEPLYEAKFLHGNPPPVTTDLFVRND